MSPETIGGNNDHLEGDNLKSRMLGRYLRFPQIHREYWS
jgi:hypothetical protein